MEEIVIICERSALHRAWFVGESREDARLRAISAGWKPLRPAIPREAAGDRWLYLCPLCAIKR